MLSATLLCWVIGVADGDTLTARCARPGGQIEQQQVRIHAIDAPELHQPFGAAARNHLRDLCLNTEARIERLETDRYGRMLAHVQCQGRDAAARLVGSGLAWVYARYASHRGDLLALQARARAVRIGLWSDSQPVPPWVWRHR